jgi:hypothetical protein
MAIMSSEKMKRLLPRPEMAVASKSDHTEPGRKPKFAYRLGFFLYRKDRFFPDDAALSD